MRKIKLFFIAIIIFLYVFSVKSENPRRIHVDRDARSIQVDGLLPEWNLECSRTIKDSFSIILDAVNTREGVAGYIRFPYKDSYSKMLVKIFPHRDNAHGFMPMIIDIAGHGERFYAVDRIMENKDTILIAEWLVPWDSLSIDSAGYYRMEFTAHNSCNDTVSAFILFGKRFSGERSNTIIIRILFQLLSIVILLILFLWLRAKAKGKSVKKVK